MSNEQYVLAAEDYPALVCHEFRVGQYVTWRGGWGTQPPKAARVTGLGDKNGQPVYDLSNGHWAYEYQLDAITDGEEV